MAGLSEVLAETVRQYILSKAAVFDGDPDLSSVTIVVRVDKRDRQQVPVRIFHRLESEGGDVHQPTPARAASTS